MRRVLFLVFLAIACSDEDAGKNDAAIARDASTADAHPADAHRADAELADASVALDAETFPDAAAIPDASVTPVRGTCDANDDCPGTACVRVPDDAEGWHTCSGFYRFEVKFCDIGVLGCCSSLDCTEGQAPKCYPGPLWHCGGAQPVPQNACTYDECASDADCSAGEVGMCIPWLAFNEYSSRCSYGDCRYDSDCSTRAGGRCMPFFDPCNSRLEAFFCTYDDSGCRADADCSAISGGYCAPGAEGASSCMQFIPPP
jgi:hypothetical protein